LRRDEEADDAGFTEEAPGPLLAMGGPMEAAAARPMAKLLTGPMPEGAETVAAPPPTDRGCWGTAPSDTCAEAATEEEEQGADEEAEG